jgi:hypothetical protein
VKGKGREATIWPGRSGYVHGTVQGPPNCAGNILILIAWDDGKRTWSMAKLFDLPDSVAKKEHDDR